MANANSNGGTVQFTPVSTGDMQEIPPDLPAGKWLATCSPKKAKTSKDGYPMLILEWKTEEALTDGNEDYAGAKAADFVVFFPQSAPASRMSKIRLKAMCTALGIDVPSATKIDSWDDLADFVDALTGLKAEVYTTVEERKDTGEQVTKISYKEPGSKFKVAASSSDDDDEEDEEEEEAPKKKAAAPPPVAKKKTSKR